MDSVWQGLGLLVLFALFGALLYGWIAGIVSASRRGRTGWLVAMVLVPFVAAAYWAVRPPART